MTNEQLTALVVKDGFSKLEWRQMRERNEALDCRVYARARIDEFIANIYNSERLHSALGYRSPLEFEAAFAQTTKR